MTDNATNDKHKNKSYPTKRKGSVNEKNICWTIPKSVGIVRANKPECLHGTLWLDVEDATRLTSEASDLVNQPPRGFADQDPHALPVSLDLPRDVRGLRHDAVVRNLRPGNNTNSGAT